MTLDHPTVAGPWRTIVVDDEPLARQTMKLLLEREDDFAIVAECSHGADAIDAIRRERPDVLFLDVQMPELDGFGVIAALDPHEMPAVVFVTAHDEYAIRAFDAHAIDYLLKPFSDERFEAALDRALRHLRAGHAQILLSQLQALLGPSSVTGTAAATATATGTATTTLDRIVLKGTDRVRLLPVQQITWIEAAGMYVRLHLRDGSVHLHRSLLGDLDAALDQRRFVRVHRSAIVNIDVIEELQQDPHGDYTVVLKDRTEVRLGRRYRARLQDRLGQDL